VTATPAPPLAGPRPRAAPAARPPVRDRIRLVAVSLVLAVLPFVTAPGKIIADTKLDLAADPLRFLARALSLWDPQQFGQLQDQASGYLFPMGPFFAAGHYAGMPPWVIQRLWIAALCIAAFLGTVRLAGRLEIGTPWTRVAAGAAYALSPAALTLLGELSAEFLPAAMLPWILLPLAGAARGGKRGRAAARSAAAVALCGGINAAATVAVLVPAVLYLLTAVRPAHRWRILAWWAAAVVLVTWWWAVPLVLLSRYGVSVLPYTESAAVTTSVTSLSDILRGTENWVGYLVVNGRPWWQLGFRIATGVAPALLTGLIAGFGLAGLVRRGLPERRFLLCCVLAGILIISAGYLSSLGSPLAGPADHLINGPASALRNLRKFDPMVRLPVALGLAHLLAAARAPGRRALVTATAAVAIAGLAAPAYLDGLAGTGAFPRIPSYWVRAAHWLNHRAGRQTVLVVPGAPFGQYRWGSPLDDVLQPLATVDWAQRDLSTIGSPGNERLLDAIDQQLAAGQGSPGLAHVLARVGVRYVLVRNDLSRPVLGGAWPARISQALSASPGISLAAQFGAPAGSSAPDDAVGDVDPPYPPVQIYRVAGAAPAVTVKSAAVALRVYGGPEALLTLSDAGLLHGRPVLLNADSAGLPSAASVMTDSLRRRVRNFGELRTSYSPTLTAAAPAATFEAAADYTEPGWARYQAVAHYYGIENVTASSSAAGIAVIPAQWASGLLPFAAVDHNPATMWESGSWTGPVGQWIQVRFDAPVDPGVIRVAFADRPVLGPAVTRVTVTTAAGRRSDRVLETASPQPLQVPRGPSGWLRITVTALAARPHPVTGAQVGISEVSVPGISASRTILAPAPPGPADPAAVLLAKAQPQPPACLRTWRRWVCSPSLTTRTEEQYGFDHGFTEPAAAPAQLRGTAVLTATSLISKYARIGRNQATVTASSAYVAAPQDQARSAFDGDPATAWIASPADPRPVLTISWPHPRIVRQVIIQRPPGAAGLLQVLISGPAGQVRGGTVGATGVVRFAPIRTRSLTIRFTPVQGPLQISGIVIPGVRPLGTPAGAFRLPCGLGPLIRLNGAVVRTRVAGSFTALLTGRPLRFSACAPVTVSTGANRVVEPATDAFNVQDVVLTDPAGRLAPGRAPPHASNPVQVRQWTPGRRVLKVAAASPSYLVVNENFNAGWQAVTGGRVLRPVRLDGWRQAWLLPAGTAGTVTLTYRPDRPYRDAIGGGLVSLTLVLLIAFGSLGRERLRRRRQGPPRPPDLALPSDAALPPGTALPADPPPPLDPALPPDTERAPDAARPVPGLAGLATPAASGGPPAALAGPRARTRVLAAAGSTVALLLAGLWLGGYPGALILTVATGLFLVAGRGNFARFWRSPGPSVPPGRPGPLGWLSVLRQPWVPAALLLAAAACAAAGERLLLDGEPGFVATGLWNTVPQVICLLVIGRLAAALIRPDS
jgi:arabinofuranan 3-O-arabinosyltransferase